MIRHLAGTISAALQTLRRTARRFATSEDGVTTIEWLAIAGVAVVMGVTMTLLATSNMSATTSYIEGKVNSAASQ